MSEFWINVYEVGLSDWYDSRAEAAAGAARVMTDWGDRILYRIRLRLKATA